MLKAASHPLVARRSADRQNHLLARCVNARRPSDRNYEDVRRPAASAQ